MDATTLTVRLELRIADESLTGLAVAEDGAAHEFVGWLGLTTAVGSLVDATSTTPSQR